jgi:general secretion pathway protein M
MIPAGLRPWWLARSRREQGLLAIMFGLSILVFTWLAVVRPLAAALEEARMRHGSAVIALAEAKARVPQVSGNPASAPTAPTPIDALISRTATKAGFTGARIAAQGPTRAHVAIDSARPQAFFAWIASLEGQGLTVDRLRVRANSDRTLSTETAFAVRRR